MCEPDAVKVTLLVLGRRDGITSALLFDYYSITLLVTNTGFFMKKLKIEGPESLPQKEG